MSLPFLLCYTLFKNNLILQRKEPSISLNSMNTTSVLLPCNHFSHYIFLASKKIVMRKKKLTYKIWIWSYLQPGSCMLVSSELHNGHHHLFCLSGLPFTCDLKSKKDMKQKKQICITMRCTNQIWTQLEWNMKYFSKFHIISVIANHHVTKVQLISTFYVYVYIYFHVW